jgi:hypothetical protein
MVKFFVIIKNKYYQILVTCSNNKISDFEISEDLDFKKSGKKGKPEFDLVSFVSDKPPNKITSSNFELTTVVNSRLIKVGELLTPLVVLIKLLI